MVQRKVSMIESNNCDRSLANSPCGSPLPGVEKVTIRNEPSLLGGGMM